MAGILKNYDYIPRTSIVIPVCKQLGKFSDLYEKVMEYMDNDIPGIERIEFNPENSEYFVECCIGFLEVVKKLLTENRISCI